MKQNTTGAPAKKTADKSKCNWVLEDQADMQLLEAVQQLLLGIVSMENAVMCARKCNSCSTNHGSRYS